MKESNQLQERALQLLQERGVTIDDIAELVHFLQKKYLTEYHHFNYSSF